MSLVRVFQLPDLGSTGFLFHGPQPAVFQQVDWFQDRENWMATPEGRADMESFLRRKPWFRESESYLVLGASSTFTIGYRA